MTLSALPQHDARTAAVLRCTCLNLRKAARAVTQLYDDVLRPTGLRMTQFSLLMLICGAGCVRITDLAEAAVMERTTLKRNLALLERDGLVRIEPGDDARVREVVPTRTAATRLAAAFPYWERAQAQVTRRLGQDRANRLLDDLTAAIVSAAPDG
jgi:DNA-binding MarR family transcriptional regulator